MATHINKLKQTAKFITYVLGRKPQEFGLIPDDQGFVNIKLLLKALNEEIGWRHIKKGHLLELTLSLTPPPIEIEGSKIRAKDRSQLPALTPAYEPPKLLYTAIRHKAYPVVHEKGIQPRPSTPVILSTIKQMAQRLGKRIDNDPVILTVQVERTIEEGAYYRQFGDCLFLADFIPKNTFSGPPLPKQPPKEKRPSKQKTVTAPVAPGSFFPDFNDPQKQTTPSDKYSAKQNRSKKKTWQVERRRARKKKSDDHY
ncbi:MAG: hypothetical protein GY874_19505 [Desulfobacteraceae bacterium]|nr:hypothetical protein [Desulfobacteraceae bacterium]